MAGTSPEVPGAWSEPDPRCCLSTPHELLPILPHSPQSHKHLPENIHSISGSWQRDWLFKTHYCWNIKNPPKIDIVAWPYFSLWPQHNREPKMGTGQCPRLTATGQGSRQGAHSFPMNTGIQTPPAPLSAQDPDRVCSSSYSQQSNQHPPSSIFWSAECYFRARQTVLLIFKGSSSFPHSARCNLQVSFL